jgi:pseudaminic acid synthase
LSGAVVRIAGRALGRGQPAYIVAEMSGNHNGDVGRAIDTIRAAAAAGADAVKLQTYTPDTLTIDCSDAHFRVPDAGPWAGRVLYDLYREAHTPFEWHERLFAAGTECGVTIFSTPFDRTAVELLERLKAPAYKIASFELADDALLTLVAGTGKPVVLSTGMASLEEIAHAMAVLRAAGASEIVVLKCTSSYPAPDGEMHLTSIPALEAITGCPVGLSDHSTGTVASVAAVVLGACFIEKHFTLSRGDGGVDSHFSLEPHEFKQLVGDVRRAEAMKGVPSFGPGLAEQGSIVFRRSLFIVQDIHRGEILTDQHVKAIRPGYGLSPRYLPLVVGRTASKDIARGSPLDWSMIGGPVA